ncbi:MAG: hypothetical protein WC859_10120 [Elusimicrobiota bacterium]|jgi:hypothetical protein
MSIPVKFTGWSKGVDNVHQDYEIPADSLRRGVNVDILDSGKVRRRKGFSQTLAATNPHSFWGDGVVSYFVVNNALHRFFENGTSTSLGTVAAGANRMAYVKVNAEVYFTCATTRGRIKSGALTSWGVDNPLTPPTLAATTGVLPPGTYYAAVTYLLADGRESGASTLASVTLSADGGVAVTSMPVPTDVNVTRKRLYLSTANGEVLYMAAEVGAADLFATVSSPTSGAELRTEYLTAPPLGVALAYALGRIFIVDAADPRVVWFTEALDYGHVKKRKGNYTFDAPVTAIAGTADGIFVGAENTYFIAGAGNADAEQRMVLEFGIVAGSVASIPHSTDVIWMTAQGPVIGKDGGVVEMMTKERMSPGSMTDAAAMVRDKDSVRQYVVVGSNTESSALQAGSYAEAEIVRRAG